jgi:hypothetical protein
VIDSAEIDGHCFAGLAQLRLESHQLRCEDPVVNAAVRNGEILQFTST